MSQKALIIFIKNPQKGHVKTRLAATTGDTRALAIYRKLLHHTRKVAAQTSADRFLYYSNHIEGGDDWSDNQFKKRLQSGKTLGKRMKGAFRNVFEDGYKRAVIIGSDCGLLRPNHLANAYKALNSNDVVIGPSQDGGYYLLGMRSFFSTLFDGKSWSTHRVFDQTLDTCQAHGWSYHVLEQLNDVDTEADWEQVKNRF